MSELGKIEKPAAAQFAKGRKLLFVPLFVKQAGASAEYKEKLDKYWRQVEEQVKNFETKLGKIHRIYHELVLSGDESGLEELRKLNEATHRITVELLGKGSTLEVIETTDLVTELSDWYRCLSTGLENPKVFSQVYEAYQKASKSRTDFMSGKINETLKPDELGILFLSEQTKITYPEGIEVFYIAPPALDELNRWLRDKHAADEKAAENDKDTGDKNESTSS